MDICWCPKTSFLMQGRVPLSMRKWPKMACFFRLWPFSSHPRSPNIRTPKKPWLLSVFWCCCGRMDLGCISDQWSCSNKFCLVRFSGVDGSNGHLLVPKDLFSHARASATQYEEMAQNGLLLQALAVLLSPKITQHQNPQETVVAISFLVLLWQKGSWVHQRPMVLFKQVLSGKILLGGWVKWTSAFSAKIIFRTMQQCSFQKQHMNDSQNCFKARCICICPEVETHG